MATRQINDHEHFHGVYQEGMALPLLAFCTSKLTPEARDQIERHLLSPQRPDLGCAAVWKFDLSPHTGEVLSSGILVAGR